MPTITLTSGVLLNQVLESHPPNAIIVDASFLERVLELLAESSGDSVVVVVNDKKGELKRLKSKTHTRLVPWEDLESFDGAGPSVAQPGRRDRLRMTQRRTNSPFRRLRCVQRRVPFIGRWSESLRSDWFLELTSRG